MILDAVGVELILTGGADAGVGRDAQLACDDLIVCRDDYDTLLFQRKVSVGLLFRHILTSLQQHTLPHQGRNIWIMLFAMYKSHFSIGIGDGADEIAVSRLQNTVTRV